MVLVEEVGEDGGDEEVLGGIARVVAFLRGKA